ncbi:MAG: glutamine amidotransferase, partial [Myxococcota bacterium]
MEWLVRLLAPDAATGAYNDWQLVTTTTMPAWAQWGLAVAVLLGVAASMLSIWRLPWRKRAPVMVLRILLGLWVLVLVFRPAVELRAVSRVRTRVALLVDGSRSMGLATPTGTRSEAVAQHMKRNEAAFKRLSSQAVVEPMLFGVRTHPADPLPDPLPADKPATDVLRALNEVSWQSSGRELGAVVLYSDGTDTEGLSLDAARRKAAQLGAPIYAVGFADEDSAPDLAIQRVVADDFAFVHNTVTLQVLLEERGLDLADVPVTLKQDGRILQSKIVSLSNGQGQVTFEFKPRRIGKQVYQVSVPVQAGEVVDGNNARSLVLKVIRDRIRVLQVAGRPSWDERFLRELLKRNPNVDLISFFILRSTTDVRVAPQDELALIPFPVHELFTSPEIDTFDVVIYQNFSYLPYKMRQYLRSVRDYVYNGGSFLMVGGDLAFQDGHYAATEVADVLPLRLGGALAWDEAPFQPRLTDQGRQHPITRIGPVGEPPDAIYRKLPPLAGFNSSAGLMPDAQALLRHPSLPGNPPVVAIREVARGRTMAVTTDSVWNWRFTAVGEGGAGREFDRFWNNALRWLIRDPDLARVRVSADKSVVLLGEPVGVEARVLGPDYQGLAGADVEARLVRLNDDGALVVQS